MSFSFRSVYSVVQCEFSILNSELENIVYSRRLVFYIPTKSKFAIRFSSVFSLLLRTSFPFK